MTEQKLLKKIKQEKPFDSDILEEIKKEQEFR